MKPDSMSILVVGLSPAWQRTLQFNVLKTGKVNRAREVVEAASGKVVNVARVAGVLGARARMITVAGGRLGQRLTACLWSEKIPARMVKVSAETRICQTLIADGVITELVEEAGGLSAQEVASVLKGFDAELRRARMVVLTGSVPPGCGKDFYARLTKQAVRRGVPVLVDAQGVQLMGAVKQGPWAVRLTREELAGATGVSTRSLSATKRAAERLLSHGAQWVVVSDGARAVMAFSRDASSFQLKPPRVLARNPIGSGDSMMAGMACGLLRGWGMRRAVAYGVACGAANAMTVAPGVVRTRDVKRLARLLGDGDAGT